MEKNKEVEQIEEIKDTEQKEEIKDISINSFAMELLQEVKAQTKRWMIAFFTVLILWFATIAGFIWYLNQYDFESYTQDGSGYNNINTGTQGDVNNGAKIPSTQEEER